MLVYLYRARSCCPAFTVSLILNSRNFVGIKITLSGHYNALRSLSIALFDVFLCLVMNIFVASMTSTQYSCRKQYSHVGPENRETFVFKRYLWQIHKNKLLFVNQFQFLTKHFDVRWSWGFNLNPMPTSPNKVPGRQVMTTVECTSVVKKCQKFSDCEEELTSTIVRVVRHHIGNTKALKVTSATTRATTKRSTLLCFLQATVSPYRLLACISWC